METNDHKISEEPTTVWRRTFRPLVVWLAVSALLLAYDVHLQLLRRTRLVFAVTVEGHPLSRGYTATLNGRPVLPGQRVGLGPSTLEITAPDADPLHKKFFVWYGKTDLDVLNLTAHKGALEIAADPLPNTLQVTGSWFSASAMTFPARFEALPVGEYRVTARYDWLREERQVHVRHGVASRVDLRPDLGTITLAADPSDAVFRLVSLIRAELAVDGRTPAQVRHLLAGDYRLRIWRGDYLKELIVAIKRGETNRVSVPFEYGQVQLVSEPAGAAVYDGDRQIGETPKVFHELKPGRYRFRLEQGGYEPAQVSFEVRGTETLTVRTNLVNIRYQTAMEKARRLSSGPSPDYGAALASVAEALETQPSHPAALALQASLQTIAEAAAQREKEAQVQAALANRRERGSALFKQLTDSIKDAALFDLHTWTVQADVAAVRAALLRTFEKGPFHWVVEKETAPESEVLLFQCKGKGLPIGRRSCVVLMNPVSPGEVQVYAEFWDYVLSDQITLSILTGVDESSWVPVHPSYYNRNQPGAAEARRRQMAEGFFKTLQNELR